MIMSLSLVGMTLRGNQSGTGGSHEAMKPRSQERAKKPKTTSDAVRQCMMHRVTGMMQGVNEHATSCQTWAIAQGRLWL